MRFVCLNNLRTRYYTAGSGGRDVLFVHGWASSGRMWLRSMWALRREYRTWALDLPGFGDSEAPQACWDTVEPYTDHVAAFCQALGITPAVVVGHSLGGRIVLDLARRYPHLAERVVAISPSITGRMGFNLNALFSNLGETLLAFSQRVWPLATAGALSTYWAPRFLGSEGVRRTTHDLRRSSSQAAIGSLRALAAQDYSPYLTQIKQPTLIICGGRDYTIPPDDARLAASLLPNARLIVFNHVHHWPTDEDHPAFLAHLRSFLVASMSEAAP